jgi:hypothetical protein
VGENAFPGNAAVSLNLNGFDDLSGLGRGHGGQNKSQKKKAQDEQGTMPGGVFWATFLKKLQYDYPQNFFLGKL